MGSFGIILFFRDGLFCFFRFFGLLNLFIGDLATPNDLNLVHRSRLAIPIRAIGAVDSLFGGAHKFTKNAYFVTIQNGRSWVDRFFIQRIPKGQ